MKKFLAVFLLFASLCTLFACKNNEADVTGDGLGDGTGLTLTARIDSIANKYLAVTVTDGAESGVEYRVNLGDGTKYLMNGQIIKKSELTVGSEIKISYNGQVTRSLPPQIMAIEISVLTTPEARSMDNGMGAGYGNGGSQEQFCMIAVARQVGERLSVEVLESEYAYGDYTVIVSEETEISFENGGAATLGDIATGDELEIVYGGEVMLSMPPQIVAKKITILK